MNPLGLLPLLVAVGVLALVPLADAGGRIDTRITQFARRYFGRYVPSEAPERRRRLRAAYVDETYRAYAAKTYVVTALAGLAAAIIGVYVTGGLLLALPAIGDFIMQLPSPIVNALGRPELDPKLGERQVLLVTMAGGAVLGAAVAGVAYWLRWEIPRSNAEIRRRGINEGLPRTVAFVFALSRGGMEMPAVLSTLAQNRTVYGDGADEISVAVREMELFGTDMITAIRRMAQRTPSDEFKTFAENLASVLQSGRNLDSFLREQYDRYREEAEQRQAEILEFLSTIAEAYVTVLVAGILFLMTILLIFGLTLSRTINFLRLMTYIAIPLANVLFIVYLDGQLDMLGVSRGTDVGGLREGLSDRQSIPESDLRRADGGHVPARDGRRQLRMYDAVRRVRQTVGRPLSTLRSRPTSILYVAVPLAVVFVLVRIPDAFNAAGFNLRAFDDTLILAALFVLGSFGIVWEWYSRRIARMERELPELLERLGSLNEAGMSVVESVERVRDSDLGALSEEVDRIWRDVNYGANVDDALRRFGLRVRTTATTRVVTLLTNALRASGSLAPIFHIASEQAESELRLRRRRRQQMFTYLVVIYLSFVVFLVIIVAIQEVLVPSLPSNVPTPSAEETRRLGINAQQFTRFGQVDKAAYTLVFFHTALIQAVMSGLVAGQLGEGSVKDGVKHAAVMLAVAYVAFLVVSSPTAQVTFEDQSVEAGTVVVDSVSVTNGGYVVIREGTPNGEIVGHSDYLAAGDHRNVRIPLKADYSAEIRLYAVPHLDTDGDRVFEFTEAGDDVDRPYPPGVESTANPATITPDESQGSLTSPKRTPSLDGRRSDRLGMLDVLAARRPY